jgi:hypothetical protein
MSPLEARELRKKATANVPSGYRDSPPAARSCACHENATPEPPPRSVKTPASAGMLFSRAQSRCHLQIDHLFDPDEILNDHPRKGLRWRTETSVQDGRLSRACGCFCRPCFLGPAPVRLLTREQPLELVSFGGAEIPAASCRSRDEMLG